MRIVEQEAAAVGKHLEETVAIGKMLPDGEAYNTFALLTLIFRAEMRTTIRVNIGLSLLAQVAAVSWSFNIRSLPSRESPLRQPRRRTMIHLTTRLPLLGLLMPHPSLQMTSRIQERPRAVSFLGHLKAAQRRPPFPCLCQAVRREPSSRHSSRAVQPLLTEFLDRQQMLQGPVLLSIAHPQQHPQGLTS